MSALRRLVNLSGILASEHAHSRWDFLPVENLAPLRLGKPLPDRIRLHRRGFLLRFPMRLRDGLQPHAASRMDTRRSEKTYVFDTCDHALNDAVLHCNLVTK